MCPASVEFSLMTCQGSDDLRHASVVSRDSQQNRLTIAVHAPTHKNTTGCERPLTTKHLDDCSPCTRRTRTQPIVCRHSQPTTRAHQTTTGTTVQWHAFLADCEPSLAANDHGDNNRQPDRFHIVGCELPLTTNDIDTQNSRRTGPPCPYCESPLTTNDKDTNNQPTDSTPRHRLRTTTHNETP